MIILKLFKKNKNKEKVLSESELIFVKDNEILKLKEKLDYLIRDQDDRVLELINKINEISKSKDILEKEYIVLKKKYRALELEYSLDHRERNQVDIHNFVAYACDNIEKVNSTILDENIALKEYLVELQKNINSVLTTDDVDGSQIKNSNFQCNDLINNVIQLKNEKLNFQMKYYELKRDNEVLNKKNNDLLIFSKELEEKYRDLVNSNLELKEKYYEFIKNKNILERKFRYLLNKYKNEIKSKKRSKKIDNLDIILEYFSNTRIYGKTELDDEWKEYYLNELLKELVIENNETGIYDKIEYNPKSVLDLKQKQIRLLKKQVYELKKLIFYGKDDNEAFIQACSKYKGSFSNLEYSRYLLRKKALENQMDTITDAIKDKIGIDQFNRLEDEIGYGEWIKREHPKQKYNPFDTSQYIDKHYSSEDYSIKFPRPTEEWH